MFTPAESERCCRELIEDCGVDARIIVRVFCDAQTILVHVFFSEYRGQILSIDNVLDFGYDYPPSLLEEQVIQV